MVASFVSNLQQHLSEKLSYLDSKLKQKSPTGLILATASAVTIAHYIFKNYYSQGWEKTGREKMGDLALRIPYVKEKYDKDIQKEFVHFQESVRKKWGPFQPLSTEIPEAGWDEDSLLKLIENYSSITSKGLQHKHLSGTIYSKSLDQGHENTPQMIKRETIPNANQMEDPQFFDHLAKKLETVFTQAFNKSHLWNSLHSDEFSVGACIDYQVVHMVANIFGAGNKEVMGFVTSGGTESLMLAMRAYRNWGIKNRCHSPGEGVIIASKTVHASILKAGIAYFLKIVLVDVDETGKVNLQQLEQAVKKYRKAVVAIVGSAPNYPYGVIDPIEDMAKIAKENGCGMHVDCCLGAFIVNHINDLDAEYLKFPGVTSLSADTHKNGMASKGSSVVVTTDLAGENLAYYSIYSLPEWSGGVYGTPKDAGSQSCVQSFNALLALLGTGKNGYKRIGVAIRNGTKDLAALLNQFEGKIKVIANPEVNVVAFKIDNRWGLQKGATYALAYAMAQHNIVLNTLKDDTVHFCVTLRFVSDPQAMQKFARAVEESLKSVETLNQQLITKGIKFPGEAGMYCALEAAMTPEKKNMSTMKYLENFLLGQHGAKDAVRAHFLAQMEPFKEISFKGSKSKL